MTIQPLSIQSIPALLWGEPSEKIFLYVHGKLASKECAEPFAALAAQRGYQTFSFDLPAHGERAEEQRRCDLWNGIADLTTISDFVFDRWQNVSLFASSLGAQFALHAYSKLPFQNCLFESPILDMEYLIHQMFLWFSITEEQLKEQQEISTSVDTLSWRYYTYIKEHPITAWDIPTHILYGAKDGMQSRELVEDFARRFHCQLTVAEQSAHGFLTEADVPAVTDWICGSI